MDGCIVHLFSFWEAGFTPVCVSFRRSKSTALGGEDDSQLDWVGISRVCDTFISANRRTLFDSLFAGGVSDASLTVWMRPVGDAVRARSGLRRSSVRHPRPGVGGAVRAGPGPRLRAALPPHWNWGAGWGWSTNWWCALYHALVVARCKTRSGFRVLQVSKVYLCKREGAYP